MRVHRSLKALHPPKGEALEGRRSLEAPDLSYAHPISSSSVTLVGDARKAFVKSAILEFESSVREQFPDEVRRKLDKLAKSPFVFFRGTADLFYRDLEGTDGNRAIVLLNGDVHPENLGVLRSPSGALFYGLDDRDESHPGPFTWDLKRSLTGLELAARERGFDAEVRSTILESFIAGYRGALTDPKSLRFTGEDLPEVLKDVMKEASERTRDAFLRKYVDPVARNLTANDEVIPMRGRIGDLESSLRPYRKSLRGRARTGAAFHRVKDLAEKKGSGTGSIGLLRYYVLIEGPSKDESDDILLELKGRRPSVLAKHVRSSASRLRALADVDPIILERWADGDRYSGIATLDGTSYKIRERHPNHGRVDLSKLGASELRDYAKVIGALLADDHTHGGIGPRGRSPKAIARSLLGALTPHLEESLITFAGVTADRVTFDHGVFAELHERGALLGPD